MDEGDKPLDEGTPPEPAPAPTPRKRAPRVRKPAAGAPSERAMLALIQGMQQQIVDLQRALAAKPETADFPEIELGTTLPSGEKVLPGTIINISSDPTKAPELRKVRWSRLDLAELYPMVDLTPEVNMWVAPHGVGYQLLRRHKTRVPSIVKDIYEAQIAQEENPFDKPGLGYVGPMEPGEDARIAFRAVQTERPVYSRIHFLRTGLGMGEETAAREEGPAPAAKTS